VGKICIAVLSLVVLSATGYIWKLDSGVYKSGALFGEATSVNGDVNILIMGLDSRLDENGNPLPADIYNALHAGDSSDGGENANVLMLLHVPGNGGKATSISIPRDDYVAIPGCPDGQCKGKIKQAYGLAFDAESKHLAAQGGLSPEQQVQKERDAGRKAEIDTVRQFLGGVPIDHFVEVTLVAFFQIAQVVQPITVCVNENTQDSYSGANFHQGYQRISASQAVAFVRQRRDYVHPELNFTDLDRERRQQAFIASLAYQLKQAGTLSDPAKLRGILDVAKQNIAVDDGLDLLSFAQQASGLTNGNISFVTLPIDHFGTDSSGEDVNIVDLPTIRALVHRLISAPASPSSASAAPTAAVSGIVDVINANGQAGLAGQVAQALVARGYTRGTLSTDTEQQSNTVSYYGSGAAAAASTLSDTLAAASTEADPQLPAGHLRVVLGSDFTLPTTLTNASPQAGSATTAGQPASGSGGDALSAISGGGIPCVK